MKKSVLAAVFFAFSFNLFAQELEQKSRAQLENETAQAIASKEEADLVEVDELSEVTEATPQEETDAESSENQIDQNLIVTKINFIGLKKTRDSYIQSRVKKFTGNSIAETDMHALETAIQLEGLFNDIKISTEQISETEAQINVSVKEKITFIPLPFATVSNSKLVAGGLVMDTNAFGQKDMFMVGGFFSSTSKTGMASFAKSPKIKGVPRASVSFVFSNGEPEYTNLEKKSVLEYDDMSFKVGLTLSEKIGDHFSFSNGFSVESHSTDADSEYEEYAPESMKIGFMSLGFGYSKSDWNGIFMSTNSASISAEFGLSNAENTDFKHPMGFSFEIAEQHSLFTPRLRMYQKWSGYYGKNNSFLSYKGPGAASVTIIPNHFISQRLVGGNAGLEVAVKKFNWGMISMYSDYQVAYTKDFTLKEKDEDYEFMHGPNGGVRVYLAKIAFPALAIGVSYNVTKNLWQSKAAMGVSF